jgi:hypothetical protein
MCDDVYFLCIWIKLRHLFLDEGIRASSATRSPAVPFFIRTAAQSHPRVLVFARIWAFIHPASSCQPRSPGSARGVRTRRKRGKRRENFPARRRGSQAGRGRGDPQGRREVVERPHPRRQRPPDERSARQV